MVKPELLRCFVAAADTGSFSAASRLIGKHLATVSGNIARLEDELGVKLFDREGKYPQLTDEGFNLYDSAKVALESIERFSQNAKQLAIGVPATVTIAIDEDLGLSAFTMAFTQLQQRWPHLKLKVVTDNAQHIFESVRQKEIDIGITPTLEGNSQFYEFKAIGHAKIDLVCGKQHPLASKSQVSNDELMACTQIISSAVKHSEILKGGIIMSPNIIESNGHSNIIELLRSGLGWAFLYRINQLQHIDLVKLSPEFAHTQLQLQYDIVWPKNQPMTEIHQFLLETIQQVFHSS